VVVLAAVTQAEFGDDPARLASAKAAWRYAHVPCTDASMAAAWTGILQA